MSACQNRIDLVGRILAGVSILAAYTLLLGAGCPPDAKYMALERQYLQEHEKTQNLEAKINEQRETIKVLRVQVAESLGSNGKTLEELMSLRELQIEGLSGGYDLDGQAGDDGVVVYAQPVDAYGDVVKAPGRIEVSIYDLDNPADKTFYQSYVFDTKHLIEDLWYDRMWTHHYTLKCPWSPTGPPAHNKLTVKVVFTHEITGQRLEAQFVATVKLPLDG